MFQLQAGARLCAAAEPPGLARVLVADKCETLIAGLPVHPWKVQRLGSR
jgi:hypothetical protein